MEKKNNHLRRGDIVYVVLGNYPGSSKQSGDRPCLVVSNNHNNRVAPILTVCPITTKRKKNPLHIKIASDDVYGFFRKESDIMVEQLTVVDKRSVISKNGYVKPEIMSKVDELIMKHLSLDTLKLDKLDASQNIEVKNNEEVNQA